MGRTGAVSNQFQKIHKDYEISSSRSCGLGQATNACDHRAQPIRSLRRQVLVQPQPPKRRLRVCSHDFGNGLPVVKSAQYGDQAAHDHRVAVAAKPEGGISPLPFDFRHNPDLTGAAFDFGGRYAQRILERRHRLAQFNDMAIAILPIVKEFEGINNVFKGVGHRPASRLIDGALFRLQRAARPAQGRAFFCPPLWLRKGSNIVGRAMKQVLISVLLLGFVAGCGGLGNSANSSAESAGSAGSARSSGSSAGSFGLGRKQQQQTVTVDKKTAAAGGRRLIATLKSARFDRTRDGAIIRATGIADRQGYHDAVLYSPTDFEPNENGVVLLEFRAREPEFQTRTSNEWSRTITVGAFMSTQQLAAARQIVVVGRSGQIALGRR